MLSLLLLSCLFGASLQLIPQKDDDGIMYALEQRGLGGGERREGNNRVTELDMVLTDEQYDMMYGKGAKGAAYKAVFEDRYRWTDGVIPFEYRSGDFSDGQKEEIQRAMDDWSAETCLTFRPATSSDVNKIRFQNGWGCNSQLGMVGYTQAVNLDASGCRFLGLYLHEIGHAIGLVHEHQLPSRKGKIWVDMKNVDDEMKRWFETYKWDYLNTFDTPYDYQSVMHYGIQAFSKPPGTLQTIHTTDSEDEWLIGRVYLKSLSYTDVKVVNKMYKCGAKCNTACPKEGFVDKNCRCVMPKDFAVRRCVNFYSDDSKCDEWAKTGECTSNPPFMLNYCRKSCNECFRYIPKDYGKTGEMVPPKGADPSGCVDDRNDCRQQLTQRKGDCNNYFMQKNCRKTCANCGVCEDQDLKNCPDWAAGGHCESNAATVCNYCRVSCKIC